MSYDLEVSHAEEPVLPYSGLEALEARQVPLEDVCVNAACRVLDYLYCCQHFRSMRVLQPPPHLHRVR